MSRLVVAIDSAVGVDAAELAALWNKDAEARVYGGAETHAPRAGAFLPPELVEWVAVPLAVNLAASAVYDLVRRLVKSLQGDRNGPEPVEELEIVEHLSGSDRVVIVRLRRRVP